MIYSVSSRTLLCTFLILVRFHGAEAQKDDCSVNFKDHYSVSETDPPTTEILRIQASPAVTWSMRVSYTQLPAGVSGKLDPYLLWSRMDNGDYHLTVNRVLDLEDIYQRLGLPLNSIGVRLTCRQPGRSAETYDVFVDVGPVNEYYPHFVGGPFAVNVSEMEPKGFTVINLDTVSNDNDVRPSTGEIYAYAIVPYDYARFHGKPQDDGRGFFTMSSTQKGTIVLTKELDFERLQHDNMTTLWLNVTVTDHSLNTNWTTIRIQVMDGDDLSPEFYVKGLCVPQPYKIPPCTIRYKASIPVNTMGIVKDIQPGPIYAYDRDTINNSVTYSLRESIGAPSIASHLNLDPNTGVLRVVQPFSKGGVYSLYILAKEVSDYMFPAQTTLDLEVIAPTTQPPHTSSPANPGGALTSGPGGGGKGGGGRSSENKSSDDCEVAIIGMAILGVAVVGLVIALFLTCVKLRHLRMGRVGSGEASPTSSKAFVGQEVLPHGAEEGSSPQPGKKRQDDLFDSLPEANGRGNKLPPLQRSGSGAADNPEVFDGTRSFEGGLGHEFFKTPGKTKVPLLLPDSASAANIEPIFIDDKIPA